MGVRIAAYAVDVLALERFLARPLSDVLRYISEHATDREVTIPWWPQGRGPGEAVLSKRAAEVLREEDSDRLRRVLRDLSRCSNTGFVRMLTEGHRRWWIGSLLDAAEESEALTPDDYAQFVRLWEKVLRGYNCGKWLTTATFVLSDFEFPLLPTDDADLQIGIWTEPEAGFVADCLRRLTALDTRFKAPPQRIGIGPETDDDWNAWVYEMIRQFLTIGDLPDYGRLAVVTFIDS